MACRELREALADYLGRVRGAAADPEHMLVCTGFMQGFSIACRWLHGHGVDSDRDRGSRLAGAPADRRTGRLRTIPVPVDEHGLDVHALAASGARAVLVTPAHQFPTGVVLSRERRAALIEWAEDGERLIVEDDYDAEYRYDRVAVGALQGLASERVLYIGSASKRLAPAMRLGWMLMPSWLAWQLIAAKAIEDGGSEVIGQLALCDFIERGELDRHVRRMRLRYQRGATRCSRRSRGGCRRGARAAPAAGLFELVELPTRSTSRRCWRRPPRAASAWRAWPGIASRTAARRACCSATATCPSRRSNRACA